MGGAPPTANAFELGPMMQPMNDHKRDMIVFRNLDMVSNWLDPVSADGGHQSKGDTHALTGGSRLAGDRFLASNPSLDQILATQINSPSPVTRLPSFALRLDGDANHEKNPARNTASWSGAGAGVARIQNPEAAYETFFPETETEDDGGRSARRRELVLDLVRSEHTELIRRLSGPEREKVEQHLQTRLDLEQRLNLQSPRSANVPRWEDISSSFVPNDWGSGKWANGAADRRAQQSIEINLAISAAALHADVSRVGFTQMGWLPHDLYGYSDGAFGTNSDHDLEHAGSNLNHPIRNNMMAMNTLNGRYTKHVEFMKVLVDDLAGRMESDGQRLLDHTVVLFCGQLANGAHRTDDLPWFTVGNWNGFLSTDRYVGFERRRDGRVNRDLGRSHNDLLLTLAEGMGHPMETIGNPEACTGPIEEMKS